MNLSISSAIDFVKKSLDEQGLSDIDLIGTDASEFESNIEKSLVEAIYTIHLQAPVQLLEGESLGWSDLLTYASVTDGVADINFVNSPYSVLKLISLRWGDSKVSLSNAYHETSNIARMQANEFVRGTYDDPVLVLMADSKDFKPHYKYYTTKQTSNYSVNLVFFPSPKSRNGDYYVSSKLKFATLNYLVSLVLVVYKEAELAKVFQQRAIDSMAIK